MRRRIAETASHLALFCCVACGSPAEDSFAELELALDSSACTLGDECERWGPLIEDGDGLEATCLASTQPSTPPVWYQLLAEPTCPFGRCALYHQQLTLDDDGSLVTLGAVQLPSQNGTGQQGGLWFTRHAPDGAPLSSVLWDFSVPPPGIEVERHAALLRDRSGRAMFLSSRAVLPFDAPRPLRAGGFSRSARPSSAAIFSTPPGWGVTAAPGPTGEWVVASHRTAAAGGLQASVTRYDRRGRALWNRTWPEQSRIEAVAVAHDRAILVLARDESFERRTLYKLDERGVVAWRRAFEGARFEPPQLVAVKDGSIYIAELVSADFSDDVRIHKLEPSGARFASWLIPGTFAAPTLASDESGNAVLALPAFDSDWLPTLDWHTFDAGACRRTSYALPSLASLLPGRVAVYADRRGARFFAALDMIGQLRERGRP